MRQTMALVFSFFALPLFAATDTWTGAVSNLWSVAGNWSGGVPSAGDDLVFPASGANQTNTNDLAAGTAFNSITFSGGAYTVNGNAILLGAGGLSMTGGTFYPMFNLGVTLTAAQAWNMEAGNYNIIVGGPTDLNGMALTLNYINSFNDFWAGAISGSGSVNIANIGGHSGGTSFASANTTTAPIVSNTLTEIDISWPGTITMNNNFSELILKDAATTGAVTMNGGGFLAGPNPGGTATVSGLDFTAGYPATIFVEGISGATPGQFSQVVVNGNVTLNGTLLDMVGNASVPAGTVLTIIKNNGGNPISGTFNGLPEGAGIVTGPPANEVYTVSYVGGTGHDVTLTAFGPVATTSTSVASSLNPSTFGQAVTFTATITSGSGTPTGTVSFFSGGFVFLGSATVDGTGHAAFTTSGLFPGSSAITARFFGTGAFVSANSTSGAITQVVNALPSSTALSSSANPSVVSQAVTFTATVTSGSGTPAGNVDFNDGATLLGTAAVDGTGHAAFTFPALAAGSHSITATFNGTGTFLGSTSTSAAVVQNVIVPTPALDGRALLFLAISLAGAGMLLIRRS